MMVFRKSKLFEAAVTKGNRNSGALDGQLADLNSYVISASIAGRKLEGLKEKVKTIFKPTKVPLDNDLVFLYSVFQFFVETHF